MKFQRKPDYQPPLKVGNVTIVPALNMETEKNVEQPWWECFACVGKAVLLHRGTGYCRKCYDERNAQGKLIG